jgi:hypothetical protein
MTPKWFAMQDGPPLPWDVGIAIYRGLYEKLWHGQSAETVHERGGGGYDEIKWMAKKFYESERVAAAPAVAGGAEKEPGDG